MKSPTWSNVRPALALAAVLSAAACSDNPVAPHDHPEAGGVVILDGDGAVLATSVGEGSAFDQPIMIAEGNVIEIEIRFLDEDDPDDIGHAFHPDPDEGQSLRVRVANEAIAAFSTHGDHGDLEGLAAGQTTAIIDLMHGSHSDFESGQLTIIVE